MSIHSSAKDLLNQLQGVIDQLHEEEFKSPLAVLSGSSIGQHIRHTLEFFICLIDGRNDHEINYDSRKHDRIIESDPALASSVIDTVIDFLEQNVEDFDLVFKACYQLESEEIVNVRSSFYRELAYNIEHAIHHMALIKIGVRALDRTILLPDHFGVASSTVRYQYKEH